MRKFVGTFIVLTVLLFANTALVQNGPPDAVIDTPIEGSITESPSENFQRQTDPSTAGEPPSTASPSEVFQRNMTDPAGASAPVAPNATQPSAKPEESTADDNPIGGTPPPPPSPLSPPATGPAPIAPAATTAGQPQPANTNNEAGTWSVGNTLVAPADATDTPELTNKISIDLRDMDILEVLKFLAIKGNLNIVGGKNISGTVSLLLNDVSVGDALEIILSTNNLAYRTTGNIMQVMSQEEYKTLYGKQFYDKRTTKIARLQYASAKNVGTMLENVRSEVGRIVFDNSTGTIVMMDTPEKVKEMEEIIAHEDFPSVVRKAPTQTEVFELKYAKAKALSEKVTTMLTKDLGKVYVDERTNKLVVSDLPHKMDEIRNTIRAFDSKTREVYIEAKIIQIELGDKYQSGVDWGKAFGHYLQETFPSGLTSYGEVFAGTLTSETSSRTGAILKFLETFGDSRVLSTPHIATVNDLEAQIMVGTREAYTTSSVTQSQATTTTAQNVAFIDVGMTLYVTPHINEDGFITMKIRPEISNVLRYLHTSQGDDIPIVQTTNADTTVMVKDGATVLIGGLMQLTRSQTRTGWPGVSRIPVVGNLFRSTNDSSKKSELIVLLTPHLIDGNEAFPGTFPVPPSSRPDVTDMDVTVDTGRYSQDALEAKRGSGGSRSNNKYSRGRK